MIVDTHTHMYLPEFAPTPEAAVDHAVEAGVGMMIMPNVDLSTIAPLHQLHYARPAVTRMAMGFHPTEVNDNYTDALEKVGRLLFDNTSDYVAVGEIGLDFYWDSTYRRQQEDAFRTQCQWAVQLGLPVIIHCREALADTLEVLEFLKEIPSGVFHSFGGSPDDVKRVRRTGDFYFGINGIATFKKSCLADTIREIGIDRLLLETDSPYLAPVPHRGKRNESAYIKHIAAYVAETLGGCIKRLEDATTASASKLFNI